jgi:hypothetical protein
MTIPFGLGGKCATHFLLSIFRPPRLLPCAHKLLTLNREFESHLARHGIDFRN